MRPARPTQLPTHPPALMTKHFWKHFAPSFCNILQQIKHPLLGMFSICFMLILIKEAETEQTVPSRWPHKCEISKLFYLPQTPLVNFFKLIPASKSHLTLRRKGSNPNFQIFALVWLLEPTMGTLMTTHAQLHSFPQPDPMRNPRANPLSKQAPGSL